MYLDPNFTAPFRKPGPCHYARFMGNGLFYEKMKLLSKANKDLFKFTKPRLEELTRMANFIAIFWAPKFLSAEKPDIAPIQVLFP